MLIDATLSDCLKVNKELTELLQKDSESRWVMTCFAAMIIKVFDNFVRGEHMHDRGFTITVFKGKA